MSTVEYRTGDLFDQPDIQALGHGVNLRGVMGSGIAPLFKRRWPKMYLAYRHACLTGSFHLGDVFPWLLPDNRAIYNLATQDQPGPNADLDALASALTSALEHASKNRIISIAIPRIGAGIGGLRWEDVDARINEVAFSRSVTVVVVSLPDA